MERRTSNCSGDCELIGHRVGNKSWGQFLPPTSNYVERILLRSFSSKSELESEFKLEYARQIGLSGGFTEAGAGNVRVDTAEANIIENVERVGPERKPQVFVYLEISREA